MSEAHYELIYWNVIPGRGEHIRLCFVEAGTSYSDKLTPPLANHPIATQLKTRY
ncbi:hypothetical protein F4823DRAFT_617031 [Ustulina deusta]|nr:hypothetical protein F4823DRAFT_617031 [Ustulina deusta]